MSYKNSFKLLTTNFSLVWKQLCYMTIVCLLLLGIGYGFSIPTINVLEDSGVINEINDIFETIYTAPKEVVTAISDTFLHLTSVITNNFHKIWFSILSTTVIMRLCYSFLKNVSFYNLASLMHYQLTCFVSVGYTRNLISSLSDNIKYSFARLVYTIPFSALKLVLVYFYFKLAVHPIAIIVGLFIVLTTIICISAIELSLFVGMTGFYFEQKANTSAFKSLFKGNYFVMKQFPRVFSNAVISILTIIVVNVFFGIFTLGTGLLITLPATMLFKAIFELCTYFGVKGERYYLSSTTIVNPLKDTDNNINNMKFN